MEEKNKRKGTPKRPIWQVILTLFVISVFTIAGWRIYKSFSAMNDGADIIFIRAEGNRVSNIYTLDVDNPDAEEIAMTDYTPNNTERIDSLAYPDDASWVTYIELQGNNGVIKQIDLLTGEISTLLECDTEFIEGCWSLDVSPDGQYMVFGGLSKNDPGEEVVWSINLEDLSAEPTLILDGGTAPAIFVNNETIAYRAFDSEGVLLYDIASGDIIDTGIKNMSHALALMEFILWML